jgi:hypothetical protein
MEHDSATLGLSGSCALCRDAPFHSTPEGWIAASAYVFTTHTGFTEFGQLAALIFAFRGLHGFTRVTAHPFVAPRLRRRDYSPTPLRPLHVS